MFRMGLALNKMKQAAVIIGSSSKRTVMTLWDVYTKPTPCGVKEVLLLILLCLSIAGCTFGLLFAWMNLSLQFESRPSFIVAGFFNSLLFLVILLVHPIRCTFSILLPSLGTQQGRKIVLSTAMIMVAAQCIPNMARNVTASVRMLQCSSQDTAEKILNTPQVISNTLSNMNDFFRDINQIPDLSTFNQFEFFLLLKQNADISGMKTKLKEISAKVKTNIAYWEKVLDVIVKLVKKLIALAFVLLLLSGCVHYLMMYLTDLKYDNIYVTHRLLELLKAQGEDDLPLHYKKKLVRSTGWKMSNREVKSGLMGLMIFIVYMLISGVIMGLDYFIFSSLSTLTAWAKEIPEIQASFTPELTISLGGHLVDWLKPIIDTKVKSFCKTYSYTIPLLPAACVTELTAPDSSILGSAGALYFTALVMLLGEVYATRLRRKICASFYRRREEERIRSLVQRVLAKKECGLGFIQTPGTNKACFKHN